MALWIFINIGSGDGLVPVRCQGITRVTLTDCQKGLLGTICHKKLIKIQSAILFRPQCVYYTMGNITHIIIGYSHSIWRTQCYWIHISAHDHKDIIKWPFVRGIHWWIPLTKASDAELWCFLWSVLEQMVVQTLEMLVIWDTITLIMMSL